MKFKTLLLVVSSLLMASCSSSTSSISDKNNSTSSKADLTSGFVYQDPTPSQDGVKPSSSLPSSTQESSSKSIDWDDLHIDCLVDITKDGEYVAEAEDCDLKGCTLQPGCGSFFEVPPANIETSGGQCIACIVAPSIIAFQFAARKNCTIDFYTVCAKHENPWSLDENVQFYVDENTPFVSNYSDFGYVPGNDWYNWKTVKLGTMDIAEGVHTMYIKVNGAFPNTDCFKLNVTNYQA